MSAILFHISTTLCMETEILNISSCVNTRQEQCTYKIYYEYMLLGITYTAVDAGTYKTYKSISFIKELYGLREFS